jgi:2-amino-4-hydroxy-6-hydroxymethyldihydropteridine diphosphokinase
MITDVYIALGSNQGDRLDHLNGAIDALGPDVVVCEKSRLYQTAPMYVEDQPAFLNMVLRGETKLSPQDLLCHLKKIEAEIGRVKTYRNGPRVIDLDILYMGDLCHESDDLIIPHPRINERRFVLMPLNDLAADFYDPAQKKTVATMLAALGEGNDIDVLDG